MLPEKIRGKESRTTEVVTGGKRVKGMVTELSGSYAKFDCLWIGKILFSYA